VYSNNAFGHPGSGRDTASITYTYDEADRVTQRMRNDLGAIIPTPSTMAFMACPNAKPIRVSRTLAPTGIM
nr:hypothetical protein [Flavobacteriales bacterium]